MNRIDTLFNNLDRWRHLPSYQLERRADVFFSIYLADILKARFGSNVADFIPEFPVRIGTIRPGSHSNQSFKIDYFVKMENIDVVLFVELKTDVGSRRSNQDEYLHQAKAAGIKNLLQGLLKIHSKSRAKRKYKCLLEKLYQMGLLTKAPDTGYKISNVEYEIQIVYLQPNKSNIGETVITFDQIADVIGTNKDSLSQRFADSLRNWAEVTAGDCQ